MKYRFKTCNYNDKRYGKPWLGIISTSTVKDFNFIDWEGRPGCAGEFAFEAGPGTLLAHGQRDVRKGRGGIEGYYVCLPSQEVVRIPYKLSVIDLRHLTLEECAAAVVMAIADENAKHRIGITGEV